MKKWFAMLLTLMLCMGLMPAMDAWAYAEAAHGDIVYTSTAAAPSTAPSGMQWVMTGKNTSISVDCAKPEHTHSIENGCYALKSGDNCHVHSLSECYTHEHDEGCCSMNVQSCGLLCGVFNCGITYQHHHDPDCVDGIDGTHLKGGIITDCNYDACTNIPNHLTCTKAEKECSDDCYNLSAPICGLEAHAHGNCTTTVSSYRWQLVDAALLKAGDMLSTADGNEPSVTPSGYRWVKGGTQAASASLNCSLAQHLHSVAGGCSHTCSGHVHTSACKTAHVHTAECCMYDEATYNPASQTAPDYYHLHDHEHDFFTYTSGGMSWNVCRVTQYYDFTNRYDQAMHMGGPGCRDCVYADCSGQANASACGKMEVPHTPACSASFTCAKQEHVHTPDCFSIHYTATEWTLASAHSHAVCGNASCGEHETLAWTAWDGTGSMPTSGNVYLTDDVSASSSISIPSGSTVSLCLNGYDVEAAHTNATLYVSGTLNLCDCSGSGSITHQSGKTGAGVGVTSTGTLNLYSGSITRNTVTAGDGNGAWVSGTLNMYGGSITQNGLATESTSAYGGGVAMQTGGVMNLYGGSITGNRAGRGGGVAVHQGTLNLYGGSITGNTAAEGETYGGGIYLSSSGSVKLQSGSIAGNVDANGAADNIYIGTGSQQLQLTLADGFTGGTYGFSAETKPAMGRPVRFLKRESGSVTQADLAHFTCQDTEYELDVDSDGYGVLKLPDVRIDVPAAIEGLKYTGEELTGVAQGEGYTLTGDKATDAGDYTATAKLEPGYCWSDGSHADADILWTIAKADGPDAPAGLTATAPSTYGGSDGSISGVDATMEYADNADFTNAADCTGDTITGLASGTYYVRVKETANISAGAAAEVIVPNGVNIIAVPTAATGLTYNGAEQTGVAEGVGYTLSGHTAVNAGDHNATATLSASYCQWEDGSTADKEIAWSIAKATPSIEWADQTVTYTGEAAALSAPAVKLAGSDTFSGTISYAYSSRNAPVDVDAYTVTASIPEQANYNAAEKTISLTIEKAVITVTPDTLSKFYSADDPELTYHHSGAVNGEVPAFTGKLEREEGEDAGSYLITLGTLALADNGSFKTGNYDLKLADGSHYFTIGQSDAEMTVSVGTEYTYGETITVTGTMRATGTAPASAYALRSVPPTACLYYGTTLLAESAVTDGRYTLAYNTTDKKLPVGDDLELTVTVDGGSNTVNQSRSVTLTLLPKPLSGAVTGSVTREYDGTTTVPDEHSLSITFSNVESVDVHMLTVQSVSYSYADAEPGKDKQISAAEIRLEASAASSYYAVPEQLLGNVGEITRIPLTAYTNPADAEMDEYCADAAAVIAKLPKEVTYTTDGGASVQLTVNWACENYDNTPNAENTFTWTVDETDSDLTYYMIADGVSNTDSITVTNDDIIPVTVAGKAGSAVYNGSAYDVSSLFTITPAEATGAKTYSIVGGTGEGSISGSELTITKAGTFTIRLDVAQSLPYDAATGSATLSVSKGEAAIPTGLTAYYGQKLGEIELPEGWRWQDENAAVGKVGDNVHKADFAEDDLYNAQSGVGLTVAVSQSGTDMSMASDKDTYVYEQDITLTVNVAASGKAPATTFRLTKPAANEVIIYCGDRAISAPQQTTGGTLTFVTNTKTAGLDASETPYTLTAMFGESTSMAEAIAEVDVKVIRAEGRGSVSIAGWTYGEAASAPVPSSDANGVEGVTYSYEGKANDGTAFGPSDAAPEHAGEYTVTATFPQTTNYEETTATADFTIAKAQPEIPTGLTAHYGQKLSEIELPENWTWQKPDDEVGDANADGNVHLADYAGTPDYEALQNVELTVIVSQADTQLDVQGESDYYYGENIVLTVKVTAVKPAVSLFSFRAAPAPGTVSVWNGEEMLFEQEADNGDTVNVTIGTVENGLIPGSYTLDVKYTASGNMNAASVAKPITVRFLPTDEAPDAILPEANENGWYNADPTLTAPEGWMISEEMDSGYTSSITPATTDGENTITYYLRSEDGPIAEKTVTVNVDKTAPVITSASGQTTDTTAKYAIVAEDATSGVHSYEMVMTSGEGTPTIVNNNDGTFNVSGLLSGKRCTFQITVTDKAGNSTVIASTVETTFGPYIIFPTEETEVHVFVGQKAEMKVVAENAYRYEWYMSVDGGTTFLRIPDATTPEYAIEYALMKDNGNLYFCRAYGESGVLYVDSPIFKLRVEETLPQTGDDTPIAWLIGLCLISLTAMLFISRRRVKE